MKAQLLDVINGIKCETCLKERRFGSPIDNNPEKKYLYLDFGGNTRVFCEQHMHYGKDNNGAFLDFEDEHDYPLYGAERVSDLIARLESRIEK
jgi:hypothetical protein